MVLHKGIANSTKLKSTNVVYIIMKSLTNLNMLKSTQGHAHSLHKFYAYVVCIKKQAVIESKFCSRKRHQAFWRDLVSLHFRMRNSSRPYILKVGQMHLEFVRKARIKQKNIMQRKFWWSAHMTIKKVR